MFWTYLGRRFLIWIVLFLICLGLGYPTLNRYDLRTAVPDAGVYAKIATDGPGAVENHFRFRVLIPFLVRPVYAVAQGHLGSWDALSFGFLIVNSAFVPARHFCCWKLDS